MKTKLNLLLLISAILFNSSLFAQLPILSGPSGSTYYQLVEDINNILGADGEKLLINEETGGAVTNFEKLVDKNTPFKLALIQEDVLYLMQGYDALNNTERTKAIKVIYPMANEEIHLLTRQSSDIKHLKDLAKHKAAIGNKNQGTYATATLVERRSKVFFESYNTHFDQALKDLALNRIDAFFMVGSAPIAKLDLNPAIMVDGLAMVPLEDFNGWAKYYHPATIAKEDYKWLEVDVPTFAVKTLLIVNESKLNEDDKKKIAELMQNLQSNLPSLIIKGHSAWKNVDLNDFQNVDWEQYK